MTQMTSIPKNEQENVMSSFWTMLRECESKVDNSGRYEPVLRLWVEQWYQQWNRITDDCKEPIWKTREKKLGLDNPELTSKLDTPAV